MREDFDEAVAPEPTQVTVESPVEQAQSESGAKMRVVFPIHVNKLIVPIGESESIEVTRDPVSVSDAHLDTVRQAAAANGIILKEGE